MPGAARGAAEGPNAGPAAEEQPAQRHQANGLPKSDARQPEELRHQSVPQQVHGRPENTDKNDRENGYSGTTHGPELFSHWVAPHMLLLRCWWRDKCCGDAHAVAAPRSVFGPTVC